MPTMERILVYKPDAATSSSAIAETNKNAPATSDDDDDSDDEIGRAIYNSSETAKSRAVAAEVTNNNDTLFRSLHTSGSKSGTKRKSDSVQDEKNKKKYTRKICSIEGCTNKAQKGGVCRRHGASVVRKICSIEGCTKYGYKGGVC